LGGLKAASILLYSSNILTGASATNSAGTYWPLRSAVEAQMSDPTAATNWLYYTNVYYNITNGTWTASP
jgi:hypothetical protein